MECPVIVAALDFSPGSAAAVVRATDLARRAGADLHLFHADVSLPAGAAGVAPDDPPSSELRVRVERFAADALGLAPADLDALGPTVAVVRSATASSAALRYVAGVGARLLVLGTSDRAGLSRLLLGDVTEACMAAAACPVLTASPRTGPRSPGPGAPVLVAVDIAAPSLAALTSAHRLAALYGAPVEVVHALRDAGPYPPVTEEVFAVYDLDPDAVGAAGRQLRAFATRADGRPPAALHVVCGPPSRVVPALAAERGAGVVVTGARGCARTVPARLGSVARAVARRAPCPVLTVPDAPLALGVPALDS